MEVFVKLGTIALIRFFSTGVKQLWETNVLQTILVSLAEADQQIKVWQTDRGQRPWPIFTIVLTANFRLRLITVKSKAGDKFLLNNAFYVEICHNHYQYQIPNMSAKN